MSIAPDISNLVRRCSENDRQAQLAIYDLFSRKMYNTSLRMIKSTAEAEDIIQESFLSAFRSLDTFRGGDVPFEAWLRRIVINKTLDHLRRKKQINIEYDENELIVEPDNAPEESAESEQRKSVQLDKIRIALAKLPENYRVIFSLYYYEGFDHGEISEILGIQASTSRSQLTRAKRKLLTILNQK